jgi:hypothetical protein
MNQSNTNLKASSALSSRKLSLRIIGRGQAAVEFALVATVAMIVLFVAVQLALIGEDALALGQMNYQGARWAAVNTCATPTEVATYIAVIGSPSVTTPGNCAKNLQAPKGSITVIDSNNVSPGVVVVPTSCTTLPTPATTCTAPPPRAFGSSVTITLKFDASGALFLGNGATPWLGLINFPTTLQSKETAMAE